jgi:L-threonylcarbamoyladenylate synthase
MLEKFNIKASNLEKKLLNYKGLSVILKAPDNNLEYLHRGTKTLAFRIPKKDNLIKLIEKLNLPLIAPSANPEGLPPAKNIQEAIEYFGNKIPIYVDEGKVKEDKPSTIVKLSNGNIEFLRIGNISPEEISKYLGM